MTKLLGAAALLCGFLGSHAALAQAAPHGSAPAYAASFRLHGQVEMPVTYSLESLQKLSPSKLDVYFNTGAGAVNASYTGVLLWDLLTTAGLVLDPAIKNGLLRKEVIVTGSDGYKVVFSLGELAPQFGGEQVIIAYAQNGAPFDSNSGFAKLIAPNDKTGGRAVSTITDIRVVTATP